VPEWLEFLMALVCAHKWQYGKSSQQQTIPLQSKKELRTLLSWSFRI
jgi:hypothetical protein